ncbi:DMT family transporter [Shewanella avicenniae]|uniref:DMT family transporter n=1 Tax=Shewanella avicenniae TaxID=2814294 RepID=UPI001E4046F6|nr:DMT family transporter [Shewanella avicenniae]
MSTNTARSGLLFIAAAVIFWGVMPVALKLTVGFVDAVNLTWFRFGAAGLILLVFQTLAGGLAPFKQVTKRQWGWLALAGLMLLANYLAYMVALKYLAPGTAQLNFQTSGVFLAIGGFLVFGERLTRFQIGCFVALAVGMLMFFNPYLHFDGGAEGGNVLLGVMLIQLSVLCWCVSVLLQRQLAGVLSPTNILLVIYLLGAIVLLPVCDFSVWQPLDGESWTIVIASAVATLLAYACFAQGMKSLPAGQVGAMLSLTPIISFISTDMLVYAGWWRDILQVGELNLLSKLGIGVIVLAVMSVQLKPKTQQTMNKSVS